MEVTNPLGHSVIVNRVYKNCPIKVQNLELPADLIELPFQEFDVILGMDWLAKHHATMDCQQKMVRFEIPRQDDIFIQGEKQYSPNNLISAAKARKLVRKGCEAYLAHVIDTNQAKSAVKDIPTVCDYPDVFPDELPGVPPDREVEFAIEVMPCTTPISLQPYRMAPIELNELKAQL